MSQRRYRSGRGYTNSKSAPNATRADKINDTLATMGNMRTTMQGSMAARWGGATTNFDWRTATNMHITPYAVAKQRKAKGRPQAPEEEAPLVGPTQAGPMTNQSFAAPESSLLPSDQSKAGMGSDSPVWSSGAEPLGYAGDVGRPTPYSAALPSHAMGTSLPWAPGRGVGAPSKTGVYPAPWLPGGNRFDSSVNDASTWPGGGDAPVGSGRDSSVYPSSSTLSLGSDSAIYPSFTPKSTIPGGKDRRPAGMNRGALDQIGVVRRSGGWPG